jgi:peroxiredoxin
MNGASAVGELTTSDPDGRFELRGVLPDIEHNLSMSHPKYRTPNSAELQFEMSGSGQHDMGDIRLQSLTPPPDADLAQINAVDVTGLPAEQAFEKLKSNHEVAYKAFRAEFDELNNRYSGELIVQRRDPTPAYCEAMLLLAHTAPRDDIALKSCLWIVNAPLLVGSDSRSAESRAAATTILQTNFLQRPEMAQCIRVAINKFGPLEDYRIEANPQLLAEAAESLMQTNHNRDVHARACFYVSKRYMDMLTYSHSRREPNPSMNEQCRKYLTRVKNEFPDYEHYYFGTNGAAAERMLFDLDNMLLGCTPPDLTGTDLSGKQIKLSDYRGKLLLVDFWEGGFGPATHDHHALKHILSKAPDRIAVVGIVSDSLEDVRSAIDKYHLDYPIFADSDRGPMFTQWNVQTWPTEILLDENGVILYRGNRGEGLEDILLTELAKTK